MTALLSVAAPEQLRFSSDALPPAERFERYRTLYAGGAAAAQMGPDFRAEVTGWRLDRAVLFHRELNDVGHARPVERLASDGFDHFTLTLLLAGAMDVDAGWGWQALRVGEPLLLDMTQPASNRMRDARVVTVSLGRERVAAASSEVDQLHGLTLPAAQAGLLTDYLRSLVARVGDLPASCIPAATQPIGMLLAVALAAGGDALQLPGHADRVRQLIEARLSDPSFNANEAVVASGLSRATLYRLFRRHGGLANYLRRRRLDRVRTALADPLNRRPFADLAHAAGFASESHAARLFHDAFAIRARDFRAAAIARSDDGTPVGRMEYLVEEVR